MTYFENGNSDGVKVMLGGVISSLCYKFCKQMFARFRCLWFQLSADKFKNQCQNRMFPIPSLALREFNYLHTFKCKSAGFSSKCKSNIYLEHRNHSFFLCHVQPSNFHRKIWMKLELIIKVHFYGSYHIRLPWGY